MLNKSIKNIFNEVNIILFAYICKRKKIEGYRLCFAKSTKETATPKLI